MPRIKNLDAFSSGQFADADVLGADDISEDKSKKLTGTQLRAYVLGGRTIDGAAGADIPTNAGIQTLTNKRLDNPKINSANPTTATSEDLNKLAAVTVSAGVINYLSGAYSNIQTQLNAKADTLETSKKAYSVAVTQKSDSTGTWYLLGNQMRDMVGLSSAYGIDLRISIVLYKNNGPRLEPVDIGSKLELHANPSPYPAGYLNYIQISSLEVSKEYHAFITFFSKDVSGV